MLSVDELRARRAVDVDEIDLDIAQQPELFSDVSDLAADTRAEAKAAKANLDAKKADIAIQYRRGLISTDVKITETSVTALVDKHEDVVACKLAVIEAERTASKMDGLVGAYEQKRSMIKYMVELMLHEMFNMKGITPQTLSTTKVADVQAEITQARRPNGRRRRNTTS